MNLGELGRLHGRSTHRGNPSPANQLYHLQSETLKIHRRINLTDLRMVALIFSMILILIFTTLILRLSIRNILYRQRNYRRFAKNHLDRAVRYGKSFFHQ